MPENPRHDPLRVGSTLGSKILPLGSIGSSGRKRCVRIRLAQLGDIVSSSNVWSVPTTTVAVVDMFSSPRTKLKDSPTSTSFLHIGKFSNGDFEVPGTRICQSYEGTSSGPRLAAVHNSATESKSKWLARTIWNSSSAVPLVVSRLLSQPGAVDQVGLFPVTSNTDEQLSTID